MKHIQSENTVGEKIKSRRLELNLTQDELAKKSRIQKPLYNK